MGPALASALTNRRRPAEEGHPALALRGAVGLFRRGTSSGSSPRSPGRLARWPQAAKKDKPPPGILVNDVHSQLNSTRVWRIVQPDTLEGIRSAMRAAQKEEKAVCISGARHAMGGQQFLADGLMIDTRRMSRLLDFDAEKGHVEFEAGIQWPQVLRPPRQPAEGRERQWTFAQKQTGADKLTIGGCLAANVHGRGLKMPPFIGDVESFRLLTAKGDVVNCSRTENAELFRLAIGGYGLFGLITSATLRLVERRKVERVVEVRSVDGLPKAFAERIGDGFLYGDFQYAIDETSEDFLRRGVFSCYRRSTRRRRSRRAAASCTSATGSSCCTSRTTPRARRSAATPGTTCRPTARCTGPTRPR